MKILLQTTIPFNADDWHAGRFSLLADELRSAGHEVTARDREDQPDGCDKVLSRLFETDFDQVWLMAVDVGNGLADGDVRSIVDFRESGGGVLAARDHQDLGASLERLHSIGIFNHFHSLNPENPERRENDDCDNPNISYPNYHSGNNGDYQQITPDEPIHELLRSRLAPNGVIEYFPAHPHSTEIPFRSGHADTSVVLSRFR